MTIPRINNDARIQVKKIWNTEDHWELNHVNGNKKWNECDTQNSLLVSPHSEDRLKALPMKQVQITLMLNIPATPYATPSFIRASFDSDIK